MAQNLGAYPASLSIDYPETSDRVTTLIRLILAIPIGIVYYLLVNSSNVVAAPLVLLLLFRQKYPRWWFDWNLAVTRFSARVSAFVLLVRDEYPSTDEEQAVHLDLVYPNAQTDLNRWLPLVKWLLAIPHIIVLAFLLIVVVVVWIIAWFVILITGQLPRGLFDYQVGVMRWELRVAAYAFLLTTDRYPPFSLEPQ